YDDALALACCAYLAVYNHWGRSHFRRAHCLHLLGELYRAKGDHVQAEGFYLQALEVYHSLRVPIDADTARRLHDLGAAVERLPSLVGPDAGSEAATLGGTGTDGPVCTGFAQTIDSRGEDLRVTEETKGGEDRNATGPNPLDLQGVEAGCDSLKPSERSSPSRIRTYNKPVNSLLLSHILTRPSRNGVRSRKRTVGIPCSRCQVTSACLAISSCWMSMR